MRCSRCSAGLATPEEFSRGLCESCLAGKQFDPAGDTDAEFLEHLLDFARPACDTPTMVDASVRAAGILARLAGAS